LQKDIIEEMINDDNEMVGNNEMVDNNGMVDKKETINHNQEMIN